MNYDEELKLRDKLITTYGNSFIMAGAGAGKTYTLVNRIVNHIKAGADVSKIVAISFTNKSAEDLKQRIIGALDISRLDADKVSKLSEVEKKNMHEALNKIDMMHISTIHKFCGDILKENSLFALVSPGFKMRVDEDDLTLKEEVVNEYIDDEIIYDDIVLAGHAFKRHGVFLSDVKRIYYILIRYVDKIDINDIYGYEEVDSYAFDKEYNNIIQQFKNYVSKLQNEMEHMVEMANLGAKELNTPYSILKGPYVMYYDMDVSDIDDEPFRMLDLYKEIKLDKETNITPFNSRKFLANKSFPEKNEAFGDYNDDLSIMVDSMVSSKRILEHQYNMLVLKHAYKAYEKYLETIDKDYDNVNNDELLYLTKKLLSDNHDVRLKLQKKYKYLYIDEYQDTDHVQRDIALLLTQDDNHNFLSDSSLFLVGDPKQSIYRFRGAEPQIYYDTKKIYDKNDDHELNINFRSNSKILDYVNFIYDTKNNPSGIKLTDDDYSNMLVSKINEISDEEYNNPKNLLGFYRSEGKNVSDIVRLIKSLKKNYKLRAIKNGKPEYREIKYSDIMVLMPGHSKMGEYVNEFSANMIPSKVAGESNFHSTVQLRVFVNLFESLNTSGDIANSIAYEVFRLLYPNKYKDKTVKESLEISKELLNELRYKTNNMSSYGVAMYLINNLDLINVDGDKIPSFEMNSIKSKLYQMVEEVFSSDYLNGKNAAKRFRDYISKSVEYESLIDDEADAVSVINIHKSKGLEAPIVIYVAMHSNEPGLTEYKNGKLYICDEAPMSNKLDYYSDNLDVYNEVARDNELELARLEYVAATRAKEAFIIVPSPKALLFSDEIYLYNDYIRDLFLPESSVEDNVELEYEEYKPTTYEGEDSEPRFIITSPSSKEGESDTRKRLYDEAVEAGVTVSTDRPKGNILGTILHRAFELLVIKKNNNDKVDYNEITEDAIKENLELVDDISGYNEFINTCLINLDKYYNDNHIYDSKLYPEFTFCYKNDNEISNGSIDLLSICDDKIVIYDYKSDVAEYITDDNVFEATLDEKYVNQLNDYEGVVNSLYNLPVYKKIIYFRRYDKNKKYIEVKVHNI